MLCKLCLALLETKAPRQEKLKEVRGLTTTPCVKIPKAYPLKLDPQWRPTKARDSQMEAHQRGKFQQIN